jgi:hypothetical protein
MCASESSQLTTAVVQVGVLQSAVEASFPDLVDVLTWPYLALWLLQSITLALSWHKSQSQFGSVGTKSFRLVTAGVRVGVLQSAVEASFPDLVDVLIGWTLDPALPDQVRNNAPILPLGPARQHCFSSFVVAFTRRVVVFPWFAIRPRSASMENLISP